MTPEAQRIAIAEACGWKRVTGESVQCPACAFILIDPNNFQVAWTHSSVTALTKYLPDYLNDLNAMHAAIVALLPEQKYCFLCELESLLGHNSGPGGWDMDWTSLWDMTSAIAAQRAEAFLRTIGKWQGGSKP